MLSYYLPWIVYRLPNEASALVPPSPEWPASSKMAWHQLDSSTHPNKTTATMASPKLVSAIDESGAVVCAYKQDAKAGSYEAIV